jgi:hypothetical protein
MVWQNGVVNEESVEDRRRWIVAISSTLERDGRFNFVLC